MWVNVTVFFICGILMVLGISWFYYKKGAHKKMRNPTNDKTLHKFQIIFNRFMCFVSIWKCDSPSATFYFFKFSKKLINFNCPNFKKAKKFFHWYIYWFFLVSYNFLACNFLSIARKQINWIESVRVKNHNYPI
jgi:hypothetical protein